MSAVQAQQPYPTKVTAAFRFSADVPEMLNELARRHYTTPGADLEKLVTSAVRFIIRAQSSDQDKPFIARVRELAAQRPHPRAAVITSYSLGEPYFEGIRQLQASLGLPRQGLVVEYLVRASWDVEGGDGGGTGGDEIERRFRSTSHNLHPLVTSPSDGREPATVQHPTRQLTLIRGGFLPD